MYENSAASRCRHPCAAGKRVNIPTHLSSKAAGNFHPSSLLQFTITEYYCVLNNRAGSRPFEPLIPESKFSVPIFAK